MIKFAFRRTYFLYLRTFVFPPNLLCKICISGEITIYKPRRKSEYYECFIGLRIESLTLGKFPRRLFSSCNLLFGFFFQLYITVFLLPHSQRINIFFFSNLKIFRFESFKFLWVTCDLLNTSLLRV